MGSLCYTGMRKTEILSLTIDKINLGDRYIDISENDTKDHEKRVLPMCSLSIIQIYIL